MEKFIFGVMLCILFSLNSSFGQFECPNQIQHSGFIKPSSEILSDDCSPSYDNCNGKIVWKNGAIYTGNFSNGKIEGSGELTFPKKFKYKGEFKNGLPHGTGKIIFEDASQYVGEWTDGKIHGEGAFLFSCGNEYIGEFKNGKLDGKGVMRLIENETYWGNWVNGKAHGQGTYKRGDGSELLITYINGEKNGEGILVFETGDTLRGNWEDGKIDGKTVFQFIDGSKITHFWESGVLKEKVVFTQKSGLKLSGDLDMLTKMISKTSLGDEGNIEKNFSLAWYAIGMEYKSQQNYDEANKNLQYAQMFIDPFEESDFAARLDLELKYSKQALEKIEVARKNDSKE